jgi:hypothetical protein
MLLTFNRTDITGLVF